MVEVDIVVFDIGQIARTEAELARNDVLAHRLFDRDNAIQSLCRKDGESPEAIQLTGVYHNLVRRWVEA